jgi:hypothetical protein
MSETKSNVGEERIAAALARFGWSCGPTFWERYYNDAWVFNLANAIDALTTELAAVSERGETQ